MLCNFGKEKNERAFQSTQYSIFSIQENSKFVNVTLVTNVINRKSYMLK